MAATASLSRQIASRKKLLEKFTIPTATELGDEASCSICHNSFLAGETPEIPVKLPCGHVFGMSCIVQWLSQIDSNYDTCPVRRRRVHGKPSNDGSMAALEEDRYWLDALIGFTLRCSLGTAELLVDSDKEWVKRAEELWRTLCEELIESLDVINHAEDWLCGHGVVVRRILDLCTVARFSDEIKDRHSTVHWAEEDEYPESYHVLCQHLQEDPLDGDFPAPGEDHFLWLADCHRKMRLAYERLLGDVRNSVASREWVQNHSGSASAEGPLTGFE